VSSISAMERSVSGRIRTADKTGTGSRTTLKKLTILADKSACPGFVRAYRSRR
jgi:hypothetical protein